MTVRKRVHTRDELEPAHVERAVKFRVAPTRSLVYWTSLERFVRDSVRFDRDLGILLDRLALLVSQREGAFQI